MKKVFFYALASVIGFASAKTYLISQDSDMDALTIQNVEALSEGDLPANWHQNFTIGTVWYRSGCEAKLVEPFLTYGWSTLRCCVDSNDANACNFSLEDDKCANTVTRHSH